MAGPQDITFGTLLRRCRMAHGLTQEELAEQAGLSPRGIRALERGERMAPRRETVGLLADALQLAGEERVHFERAARVSGGVVDVWRESVRPLAANKSVDRG